jgi:hypothetical protein
MKTIGREESKQMLDRKDHFRLVMALGEWAYQAKHIPGSIHLAYSSERVEIA